MLYKLSNSEIVHMQDLSEHNEKIIGCRFSSVDNNLLYTGSVDGTLKVWDVRTPSKSSATLAGNNKHNSFKWNYEHFFF